MKISKVLLLICLSTTLFAISKEDKRIRASLYPYVVKGITYYPHKVAVGTQKEVLTSWYGEYFHGRKTAIGEVYDMYAYTAAHKTYPLGTILLVTNPKNAKSLKVRVNDRGPFWNNRELDLSMAAAEYLDTKEVGVAWVSIEVISVPKTLNSFTSFKRQIAKKQSYNVGYTAISYASIDTSTKKTLFEIGTFMKREESNKYLKKLHKYFPKAYVTKEKQKYKVNFYLSANEDKVLKSLKKLKKIGLITGYGLCWSY